LVVKLDVIVKVELTKVSSIFTFGIAEMKLNMNDKYLYIFGIAL